MVAAGIEGIEGIEGGGIEGIDGIEGGGDVSFPFFPHPGHTISSGLLSEVMGMEVWQSGHLTKRATPGGGTPVGSGAG